MGKAYKQNDMYVVELADTEWYGAQIERDALEAEYRASARQAACSLVSVFVVPDPIFPICDKREKHRVYECRFPASDRSYRISATFTGEIDDEIYFKASEFERAKLVRAVRDDLNTYANGVAGTYIIVTSKQHMVERGRV